MLTKCPVCEQRKKQEQCEGFSNKETWAVALHLDNNQWMQNAYLAERRVIKSFLGERRNVTVFADKLKLLVERWHEDFYADTLGHYNYSTAKDMRNMFCDVGSLLRVDWKELAEHLLKD